MATSLGTSVFGLRFDFNTRNKSFDLGGGGEFGFSLKYFSLLILRLCIAFQLHVNLGSSNKICGGGGGVLFANLLFCFGPNLFP